MLCLNGLEGGRNNCQKRSIPADSSGWPHEVSLCRWLAKHARLCSTLHITTVWTLQGDSYQPGLNENLIAAGLAAAAGQRSLLDKPLTRRAAAAAAEATAITAAREAAAAGPSSRLYQQQQGLPLQSLSSSLPSDGRLLCTVSGSTQLTQVKLQLRKRAEPAAGCRQALASLTGKVIYHVHGHSVAAFAKELPSIFLASAAVYQRYAETLGFGGKMGQGRVRADTLSRSDKQHNPPLTTYLSSSDCAVITPNADIDTKHSERL